MISPGVPGSARGDGHTEHEWPCVGPAARGVVGSSHQLAGRHRGGPWAKRSARRATRASSASATARRCARTSTSSSGCWRRAASSSTGRMTGLEIELNLVDERLPAARSPTPRCSRRSPTPTTRPSSAHFNIELNVPPRPLPGDAALELEDELRGQPQPRRDAGATSAARTS